MKYLPFLLALTTAFLALPRFNYALPTTVVEVAPVPTGKKEVRAQRKVLRQELKAARRNAPMTEERLNRRSNLALLLSIVSIPLMVFTAGLILFVSLPFTRRVLTDYLFHPEFERGYQRARAARAIVMTLGILGLIYLTAGIITILSF